MPRRTNPKVPPVPPEPTEPTEPVSSMFSPASFAGVLSKLREGVASSSAEPSPSSPPVVAFYGFRGGAGRTTALAHVAALLSNRQVSVVALDLDLEAPGLHHLLGCPEPEEDRGVLALLRTAATVADNELDRALRLAPHVVRSELQIGAPIRVLPAGRLSAHYLDRLDDLGVPLWHLMVGPNPLELVIARIKEELTPDAIFLDCRTGLSGLSASALFHTADIVVCFVPVSKQSLDGLEIFFKGLRASRAQRAGRPEVLIVPSMVPEGPEGQERLRDFIADVEQRYLSIIPVDASSEDVEPDAEEIVPIVRSGIEYRRAIALIDAVGSDFVQRAAGTYQALTHDLDALMRLGGGIEVPHVDARTILEELATKAELEKFVFADDAQPELIASKFIQPGDFRNIVDHSTWYVVGSKGAGKTWLWQYLLSGVDHTMIPNTTFVAAHASKDSMLSPAAIREIEQNKKLHVRKRQLHGTFWLLYAINRILQKVPDLARIGEQLSGTEKALFRRLAGASESRALQDAIMDALTHERAGTFAEGVVRKLDTVLLARGQHKYVMLYDGLDVGFGSQQEGIASRQRFIDGLAAVLESLRGVCKRIGFKVFLREDIFAEIGIQNQSHLAAASVQLKWKSEDIWKLALNLVSASPEYMRVIQAIDPGASSGRWPEEETRLQALLVPLWGDKMEGGNKATTARWIQRRTSDGLDRLFPRTLVQFLIESVKDQRKADFVRDRVLRSSAIKAGYMEASRKRVNDLQQEYVTLAPYLQAIAGMKPTGTGDEIREYMSRRLGRAKRGTKAKPKGNRMGAPAGALHAGPGGWNKVIERLKEVGVLREYRKARGGAGETKYEIALLYRPGLGIKMFGG
jgi:MinD-like ATPase involved in chromosome partitioning or flagellar assembly